MEIFTPVLTVVLVVAALVWGWVLAPTIAKGLNFARNYVKELLTEERVTNGYYIQRAWRHDRSKLFRF